MSLTRPAPQAGAHAAGDDLFAAFGERSSVVIQHCDAGVSAIGRSRNVVVPAGPDHVARAAALTQTVLAEVGGTAIALGALPYSGGCEAVLRVPDMVLRDAPAFSGIAPEPAWAVRSLIPEPLPVDYKSAVERALEAIEAGEIEKVVLARSLAVEADRPIDPRVVARRLSAAEPGSYVFLVSLPGGAHAGRRFPGAASAPRGDDGVERPAGGNCAAQCGPRSGPGDRPRAAGVGKGAA